MNICYYSFYYETASAFKLHVQHTLLYCSISKVIYTVGGCKNYDEIKTLNVDGDDC